ncbi:MAG: SGNH/GDSL hydrolase family protein [Candidatus Omnitrophota bacterium]
MEAKAHDGTNSTGANLHVNSKGYRGREFDFNKPSGATRIVFYGGSAVFDIGNSDPNDWPHQAETLLHQKGFQNVEVINAGVPSFTTIAAMENFLTEGYRLQADYVILYCVWNDIHYFAYDKPLLRRFDSTIKLIPLFEYQNIFDRILCHISQLYNRLRYRYYLWKDQIGEEGRLAHEKPTDQIQKDMLAQYRISLETFVDLVRNAGAEPILMTEATLVNRNNIPEEKKKIRYDFQSLTPDALVQAYEIANQIAHEVASRKKTVLIDASSELSGRNNLFNDHVHTTPAGSIALAQITAEHIKEILTAQSKRALSQAMS